MTDEENFKTEAPVEEEEDEEETESESEETEAPERDSEDTEKAHFEEAVKATFDTLADQMKSIAQSQKAVVDSVKSFNKRIKALETPSDLPLSPKGNESGDDVGADVKVPEDPYPQGKQVGLDDDGKETENDDSKLSMQKKPVGKGQLIAKSSHTFTTETPRPNAAIETLEKSDGADFSPILKDARAGGYEGLSKVARQILTGKYYKPSSDEVGQW
jgi:hypothetical protein